MQLKSTFEAVKKASLSLTDISNEKINQILNDVAESGISSARTPRTWNAWTRATRCMTV